MKINMLPDRETGEPRLSIKKRCPFCRKNIDISMMISPYEGKNTSVLRKLVFECSNCGKSIYLSKTYPDIEVRREMSKIHEDDREYAKQQKEEYDRKQKNADFSPNTG